LGDFCFHYGLDIRGSQRRAPADVPECGFIRYIILEMSKKYESEAMNDPYDLRARGGEG
jgi:hypothetical protein